MCAHISLEAADVRLLAPTGSPSAHFLHKVRFSGLKQKPISSWPYLMHFSPSMTRGIDWSLDNTTETIIIRETFSVLYTKVCQFSVPIVTKLSTTRQPLTSFFKWVIPGKYPTGLWLTQHPVCIYDLLNQSHHVISCLFKLLSFCIVRGSWVITFTRLAAVTSQASAQLSTFFLQPRMAQA